MMTNTTLSDAELDLVSGGVRDNPWSDAANQQAAQQNGAGEALGQHGFSRAWQPGQDDEPRRKRCGVGHDGVWITPNSQPP